jgi:2-oxoglutarate dehydrogenase E1 component
MSLPPRAVSPSVNGWNADYLEAAYQRYLVDPSSVSETDRAFFRGFELAQSSPESLSSKLRGFNGSTAALSSGNDLPFQVAVDRLIESFRELGHVAAKLDPFGRSSDTPASLAIEYHGLQESDLDRTADGTSVQLESGTSLREIVNHLRRTYCGSRGVEFMHLSNMAERAWFLERLEAPSAQDLPSSKERLGILEQLLAAEVFESFLGKRYPGEKRFSVEGSESAIPLLERLVNTASKLKVEEVVFGMAHRGRLSVLRHILGKTLAQIFTEFEDNWEEDFADGGGDVKYHRGYSGKVRYDDNREIHLTLTSNPSHLEAVDPVVMGRCRAKQRLRGDIERKRVVPLLIHGDAAVSGQGVVAEVLNLSGLEGYTVGGTVHVVINNMIGFTTAPEYGRTSRYCTDIAKFIEAPVIHVNGEDPEAVVAAAELAMQFRQQFGRDVFIDLWCYRKYGHNEQDEATFTQPVLYKLIKDRPSVLKVYAERLLAEGVLTEADMNSIRDQLDEALNEAQRHAKATPYDPTIDPGSARWAGIRPHYSHTPVETGVPLRMLEQVCKAMGHVPDEFNLNPKLKRMLAGRAALPETKSISYADAESLAYGTLLLEGNAVRLSGQDCRRGTFSHRHAVLRDYETGESYCPLNSMLEIWKPGSTDNFVPGHHQAKLCVHDSPLSEEAVLGFEYGYALADPGMLVLWEAQFGDFVNGAQTIIDQFITSAEAKWDRWNGLVMLLPHGYEGMGPEHSSCRVERFLKLCANENIQVVYPSTASQIFHLLRRQVRRAFRKPLVVLTPKSLLRHESSSIEELVSSRFSEILDDPRFEAADGPSRGGVKRVTLCTGKLYWELAARRDLLAQDDQAIIRVEQIYPFHGELMTELLRRYPNRTELQWVQEEPRNSGCGLFVADRLRTELQIELDRFISRPASSTPAVGSKKAHKYEQELLLTAAVGAPPSEEDSEPSDKEGTGERVSA